MKTVVKCKTIVHNYESLAVVRGVDLEINEGELLSIVGRSGAGKSTLLQIMGTLLAPTSGEVIIDGCNITKMHDKELSAFRASKIGFVFQAHHLLPELTALENVMLSALIAKRSSAEAEQEAKKLLEMVNLSNRIQHKPATMSGGEQQRVAVARALINRPMVVFADEPTGNLDSASRSEINELFLRLRKELGQTFVIVTHENDLAEMCDRKITMSDGKIIEN